ncbi:uncharacterized membrane protein C688.16 isoform X2 [Aplysia californica]|uniref:Transmembrane protein 254 n=1 Tax=Aplysia californica TaxID=6500 RepID=A0ABM1W1Q7_APLCA|nr:uncharacterized membrane protein C688.16 isoform X2 [Aplysia californica]
MRDCWSASSNFRFITKQLSSLEEYHSVATRPHMATVSPNKVPSFLGPFASLAVFMGTTYPNICLLLSVFAVLMHSLEAAFAGKLCHDRDFSAGATAKWTVSTFFFGGSSLVRLWPAKPPYKIV